VGLEIDRLTKVNEDLSQAKIREMFRMQKYSVCLVSIGNRECGQVIGPGDFYKHFLDHYQEVNLVVRQSETLVFYPEIMIDKRLGLYQNSIEAIVEKTYIKDLTGFEQRFQTWDIKHITRTNDELTEEESIIIRNTLIDIKEKIKASKVHLGNILD
jgi:hypothetical protein